MGSNQEKVTHYKFWWGFGAAVREGCRIVATTSLSLLLPLSFLLLARMSASSYFWSVGNNNKPQPNHENIPNSLLGSLLFHMIISERTTTITTTTVLSIIFFLISIATLTNGLTGKLAALKIDSHRLYLHGTWILIFLIQVCMSLGIQETIDVDFNGYTMGSLNLLRRAMLAFGLHEIMVFWWRSLVKPVVDPTVYGFSGSDDILVSGLWVEKAVLAVAFGYLWWRRLREMAEALVVLPWAMPELSMNINIGWWLYYLTVAIGVVRLLKGLFSIVELIFRFQVESKKSMSIIDDASMNVADVRVMENNL